MYFQSTRCTAENNAWVLDTNAGSTFPLTQMDCAAVAEKRKFISDIYYVRDYAVTVGDGIPTLMRSQFALAGVGDLRHLPAVAMVEGIEGFRVELGIDNRSKPYTGNPTGSPVNYAAAVRGRPLDAHHADEPRRRIFDGAFVACSTATPGTGRGSRMSRAVKFMCRRAAARRRPGIRTRRPTRWAAPPWAHSTTVQASRLRLHDPLA
jgi:type IV pilus assembly protein PilW